MSAAKVVIEPRATTNFSALGFFRKYEGVYRDLWTVLRRSWTNLATETAWGVKNVPGPEHGLLNISLEDSQRRALLPLLRKMGFFNALALQPGKYDELDVTGAKYDAMRRRTRAVANRLEDGDVSFDRLLGMFGQRPRTDAQDGTVEEIYDQLSPEVQRHPWIQQQMLLMRDSDPTAMWNGAFATEFELGTLAFVSAVDGDIRITEVEACTDTTNLPGIPPRKLASCTLSLHDATPVVILNAPAVERPHGAPRPTTISTTAYWQTHYTPKRTGKVVAVSGKTHWYRVIGDFERQLHEKFPGITVFGMSEAAGDDKLGVLNNALAEAVWLLQKALDELQVC